MWRIRDAIRRRSTIGGSSKSTKESHTSTSSSSSSSKSSKVISPAAAQTVLKTPELLEVILIHLDQDALLKAQRVCRQWKDIISTSLPLRRILYLSPSTKVDERIPIDNHWLKSRFPDLGVYLLQGNPKWRPKFIRALSASDFENVGINFFSGAEASWRDMLLTQPPIKEVVVYASLDDSSRRSSTSKRNSSAGSLFTQSPTAEEMNKASVAVRNNTGITMGMIFDASIEANKRGFAIARKRLAERKDSGYNSMEELAVDDIEVAVVEVDTPSA